MSVAADEHFGMLAVYNVAISVSVLQIANTMEKFQDKGRSNHVAQLYGHGDGGQGPR